MTSHESVATPYPVEVRERVVKAIEMLKEAQAARTKTLGSPELIEEQDMNEPFYIIDLKEICLLYKEWRETLPCVVPYYAVKCNPNDTIIQLFSRLGMGFDCASSDEINRVSKYGVNPDRIIFANPCKMACQIQHARKVGVKRMTFDNVDELIKVARYFPDAEMVLRIITDDSHSACRFSTKFGAQLKDVPQILAEAQKLGVKIIGVSFHVGSGCGSADSHAQAALDALEVFEMGKKYGFNMNLLDIGGGFQGGIIVKPSLAEIAEKLLPVLAKFPAGTKFIAEPGRFFVAKSHTAVANIHSRRVIYDEVTKKPSQVLYYINDGVYHSYNCLFFDHQRPVVRSTIVPGSAEAEKRLVVSSTVFGPTCDSLDCVAKDCPLPLMEVGEWVFATDMGAYTIAAATHFNGFAGVITRVFVWGDEIIRTATECTPGVEDHPLTAEDIDAIVKKQGMTVLPSSLICV